MTWLHKEKRPRHFWEIVENLQCNHCSPWKKKQAGTVFWPMMPPEDAFLFLKKFLFWVKKKESQLFCAAVGHFYGGRLVLDFSPSRVIHSRPAPEIIKVLGCHHDSLHLCTRILPAKKIPQAPSPGQESSSGTELFTSLKKKSAPCVRSWCHERGHSRLSAVSGAPFCYWADLGLVLFFVYFFLCSCPAGPSLHPVSYLL